jgi:hypothetical protein
MAVNFGLTSRFVNALAIDPSAPAKLYAGTQEGVFDHEYRGDLENEFARLQILPPCAERRTRQVDPRSE